MNNIVWLSLSEKIPARGYWDQFFLEEIFSDYIHQFGIGNLKEAIVIIPGAYQAEYIDQINAELSKLDRCAVIITSDEEGKFPINQISHSNARVYGTYAQKGNRRVSWLPIGYPPQVRTYKGGEKARIYDWSFSGQVNHKYRESMVDVVSPLPNGWLTKTGGFSQGLPFDQYYDIMAQSKVVLCPRGNVSPDSFRVYEALELGCIPIVEDSQFWKLVFGDVPFLAVDDYRQWSKFIKYCIYNYQTMSLYINDWWHDKKLSIREELRKI